jgi:dTDP-4-amino-4,6-dideoxygalactose transaminase
MGLTVLPYIVRLIQQRKDVFEQYVQGFAGTGIKLLNTSNRDIEWNYAYCPAIFQDEDQLLRIKEKLEEEGIFIRRYFYPSLNTLPFLSSVVYCCNSEQLACRVAALPFYPELGLADITKIIETITVHLQPA